MLLAGTNSGTALASGQGGRSRKSALYFNNGAGSSALTNEQCNPTPCTTPTTPWRWPRARAVGGGGARRQELVLPDGRLRLWPGAGGRYRQGGQSQAAARCWAVSSHPLNASDFSSLPAAGAKLQGANPGSGQRRGRHHQRHQGGQGIRHQQDHEDRRPAGVLTDIHSLGLKNTEGLLHTTSWYWDMNDRVAQVRQQVLCQNQAHAHRRAGGRLLGHDELPEGR